MGTSPRSAPFLLRDKIRLFDRFALDNSPLNTSRSVRDDQTKSEVAMFPGWKHVPLPPPQPIVLPRKSNNEPISAFGISTDSALTPRIVLKDTDFEPVEDTIKRIMDEAIEANTHALTARFQAVLKQQCSSIEQKHQALAEKYRQRVTKAMLTAKTKLDRCRAELTETKTAVQAAVKVSAERDDLRSKNEDLRAEMATLTAQMKQEKAAMNTKVKFLRALIADNARSKTDSKAHPSLKKNPSVPEEQTPWTDHTKSNSEIAKQSQQIQSLNQQLQILEQQKRQQKLEQIQKQQQQQETNQSEQIQRRPDQDEAIETDPQEEEQNGVTKLIEELETKQEEITKLTKEKKLSEQRNKVLKDENAKLKEELNQEKSLLKSERQQLSQKIEQAQAEIGGLTMQLYTARLKAEELTEKDIEIETELKLMQENFATIASEKAEMETSMMTRIGSLKNELKRTRRAICIRSLLFQAHLKTIHSSVMVCDKIDEYLDGQLTCKQCLGTLRKPQVLYPCGHSFCEPCIETLKDPETKRLVCCDCDCACEAITVTNSALDAIISQYNWWKVSLDDLRKKYVGAQGSLAGENNSDPDFAVALSASANNTNPVLRPSLATLNRQYSKQK